MSRKDETQIWADNLFVAQLHRIRAQKLEHGHRVRSISAITKEMAKTKAFKDMMQEMVIIPKVKQINIKYDGTFK